MQVKLTTEERAEALLKQLGQPPTDISDMVLSLAKEARHGVDAVPISNAALAIAGVEMSAELIRERQWSAIALVLEGFAVLDLDGRLELTELGCDWIDLVEAQERRRAKAVTE